MVTSIRTEAVISSVNIPTIPLSVAQAMSPAPRPPSPTARDATQRALRRENTSQLSSRDAQVLMGLPSENESSGAVSDITGDSTTLRGDGSTLGPPTPHLDRTPRTSSAPVRPTRRQVENSVKSIPVESVSFHMTYVVYSVLMTPILATGRRTPKMG
jgi:hypothetical protein